MKTSRILRVGASMGVIVLLAVTTTLALAATASAQVVSDPRLAEFDPSPDHWQTLDNGEPAVMRYALGVYTLGASAPFATADVGKPSPDYDGKIRYDFFTLLAAWQLPGGDYEARVSAVGPEGAAMSGPSNAFTISTGSPCTFSLSTARVSAPASGGSAEVDIVTGTGCEWAVTNAPSWVTLWMSGGSGGGKLAFGIQTSTSTSGRTGAIDVAGQTLTVSQDGATVACAYGLSPSSVTVDPAAGGTPGFSVTAGPGCTWTATGSQSWITVTGGSGSGNGTVSLAVSPNPTASPRTGTVTVEGQIYTVAQPGLEQTCRYSVSDSVFSFSAASGADEVDVTTGLGCAWTAASSQSWLVPAVTGGSGNGKLAFTVKQNNGMTNRQATLTVGPWSITVFQSGKARRTK